MRRGSMAWRLLLVASSARALSAPAVKAGAKTTCLGEEVRAQFPALDQDVQGSPLIYLDSAATSQKPLCVLDAEADFYRRDNANVHRGAHTLATRATEAYEKARDQVAGFLGADRSEIVWTRGATEAINLVANAWAAYELEEGDEILLTVAEHHSNIVPWQLLAERRGLVLKFAPLTAKKDKIDVDALEAMIGPRTKLVAVQQISNVLGSSLPIERIVAAARAGGAPDCAVLVDACQSAPHMVVDVKKMGADFLVASGHKMCGPTGIGVLWAKPERLLTMRPWHGGGEMIDTVTLEGSTFALPPARFEAGTPPIAQAVAMGRACDYLQEIGMARIAQHEHDLAQRLLAGLLTVPGITVYGPPLGEPRAALAAFNSDQLHAADLSFFLDQEGVAVRAGHHCAQPLHNELWGAKGSCRASLALYNTPEDVDTFIRKIKSVLDFYGETSDEQAPLELQEEAP